MRWFFLDGLGNGWFVMIAPLMILFWATIIIGLLYLFKSRSRNVSVTRGKTPLEILQEQYAKGEITEDEYERIKKKL